MPTLADIAQHVNDTLFTYFMQDGSIICDNGFGNVQMKNRTVLQYDFVDTNDDPKQRTEVEEEKIKLLNEMMKIMLDIQRYVCLYGPVDSPSEYRGCDDYTCGPGCDCGAWEVDMGCGNVPDTIHNIASKMQEKINEMEPEPEQSMIDQMEEMDIN